MIEPSLRTPIYLLILISLLPISCASLSKQDTNSCVNLGDSVLVDTSSNRLWLCQSDVPVQVFGVAIGRGGTNKRKDGDNRTPLGEYTLGVPRESGEGFHRFIPVGYPTRIQQEQGFSGGAIGIHGPSREWKWLGSLTTWVDWTKGCIAVSSDIEIEAIERWVNEYRVKRVTIQ